VLAYPDATILDCSTGLTTISYDEAEPVRLTQSFLEGRERFLRDLLAD
jgi:predicted ATPase